MGFCLQSGQRKRVVRWEREYPGSSWWPIYEILCPDCGQWSDDYGEVDILVDGKYVPVCTDCGKAYP